MRVGGWVRDNFCGGEGEEETGVVGVWGHVMQINVETEVQVRHAGPRGGRGMCALSE